MITPAILLSPGIRTTQSRMKGGACRLGLCLGLIVARTAGSQTLSEPVWEWAAQAGGGLPGSGYGLVVDAEGNTCSAGTFFDMLVLGTNVLHCPAGCAGYFVAKHDPAGQAVWAQSAYAESGAAYGFRLAVDGAGNVIWTGLFHGQIHLGRSSLNGEWGRDYIFLAKLDRDGNLLWVQQADGVSEDSAFQSAVDPAGNVYLSGAFPDRGQIGERVLTSRGGHDVFLAKYDAGGAVAWVQQAGGAEFDESKGLSFDAAGNVYLTGSFSGTAQFGETNSVTSAGAQDVFVAKFDSAGGLLWVTAGGGLDRDLGHQIAVDPDGQVYVAGTIGSEARFDPVSLTSNGRDDLFLLKCDSSGRVLWATSAGDTDDEVCHDMRLDAAGNAVLTGSFHGWVDFGTNTLVGDGWDDLFVVKYDGAGQVVWASAIGGGGGWSSRRGQIGLDAQGTLYMAAPFTGSFSLGTNELSTPEWAFFVARFDSVGQVVWIQQAVDSDRGSMHLVDASVDPAGAVYVQGEFYREVFLGPHALTNSGYNDLFLAKVVAEPEDPSIVLPPQDLTAHLGTTARLTCTPAGASPRSIQWFKDGVPMTNDERIAGATGRTLTLRQLQLADGGSYRVTVSNAFGIVTSAGAILTVDPQPLAPTLVVPPSSLTAARGDPVTFLVVVQGSEPFTWQWRWNGTNLADGTNATLTLPRVELAQAGDYVVVVSNAAGVATSAPATLLVLQEIGLQEALDEYSLSWENDGWFGQDQVTHDGMDAAETGGIGAESSSRLRTVVTGPGTLTFYWKASAPDDASLSFHLGNESWAASVSGETDWERRSVHIPDGPQILQWHYGLAESSGGGQNRVWVDDVHFTPASVAVGPTLLVQPRNQSAAEGDSVRFAVEVEGSEPLSYRWQRDGMELPGPGAAELVLSEVTPGETGAYCVIVSNWLGSVTSAVATLSVNSAAMSWVWSRDFAGVSGAASGTSLAVDEAGVVYVAGVFDYGMQIGTNAFTGRGGGDLFVAKFDRQGNVLWAQSAGSDGYDTLHEIAATPGGGVVLSGSVQGGADFGRFALAGGGGVLARYDAEGTVLWATNFAAEGYAYEQSGRMAVDRQGNIYLTGVYGYPARFGDIDLAHIGSTDVFLAKYDAAGQALWARAVAGEYADYPDDLAVDGAGTVYLSGRFTDRLGVGTNVLTAIYGHEQSLFLARFDADGHVRWARTGEPNHWPIYTLAGDGAGNLIVRSCFSGTTTLGTQVLSSAPGGSYFLAKYDADGAVLWARQGEGTGGYYRPESARLLTDLAGNLYFKGVFTRSLTLDGRYVTGTDSESVVVAKYDSLGRPLWARCAVTDTMDDASPAGLGVAADGAVYVTGFVRWTSLYLAKLAPAELCFTPLAVGHCTTNGVLRLQLRGLQGGTPVVIEASTDLLNWVALCTNAAPTDPLEIEVPMTLPVRFHRAVVPYHANSP